MWKRWAWIAGLGGIALAGIFLAMRPQPVAVEVARVTAGPLRVTIEEEGKTRLRSRYVVSAPVAGFTRRLAWKAGDTVAASAVIAMIEPPRANALDARARDEASGRVNTAEARAQASAAAMRVAEARVRTAEEQARVTRTDLEYWRKQRDREDGLRKSGDIAAERFDRTDAEVRRLTAALSAAESAVQSARVEVDSVRAQSDAAKAEVSAARATLRQPGGSGAEVVTVRAPAAGRVVKLIRESEGVVAPGEPLVEIGDSAAIEVEVEVLSPDAVKMAPGTRVILDRWGGDAPLDARVRVIEPGGFTKVSALGVEEQRVRVIAAITSPQEQWRRLGDGYRVEARFVLWESERVAKVAANALFRFGDAWAVFVVDGGAARRRVVKIGHRNGLEAEVLDGLKEGDTVVAHPDDTVEDGKLVAAK